MSQRRTGPLSAESLLLTVLVVARVRIDTLADLVAPRPEETIRGLPLVGGLLDDQAWALMRQWLTDPFSLLLIAATFALLGLYFAVDAGRHRLPDTTVHRIKLGLIVALVGCTVVAQSLFLIALRQATGPAAFTHDGGVIQTEAALDMLLAGENPYAEDYLDTPLAEWGLEKRTALYHYPYLPWTLLSSIPAKLLIESALGWYDQRFVYLALFALTLALLPGLAAGRTAARMLLMVVALNPIMGNDIIFGMNDSFVLAWMVFSLWLLRRGRTRLAAGVLGLALASKPTAWFLAPFYALYLVRGCPGVGAALRRIIREAWPAVVVFAILVLPFAAWDPAAFYDDVWAWSAGTSSTPYQIRGWGLSNLVLALGLVESDQSYFPFWIIQALVCAPALALLMRRLWREPSIASVWYGTAMLFGLYSFTSRFFNENYVGFLVALLALSALSDAGADPGCASTARPVPEAARSE